jgi:hypothetical protein
MFTMHVNCDQGNVQSDPKGIDINTDLVARFAHYLSESAK